MEVSSSFLSRWLRPLLAWISLLPVLVLVFYPALNGSFLLDDSTSIQSNSEIREISTANLVRLVRGHQDVRAVDHHPVSGLSFMIDYQWAGLDPFALHISNLLYHWFAAGAVMLLMMHISQQWLPAAAIMWIWSVHPFATMPVAYITCRQETLLTFFYLASILAFLRGWQVTSIVLGVASFLCKEVSVTLPGAIWLADWATSGTGIVATFRNRWRYYLSLTVIWLGVCAYHLRGARRHEVFAAGMPLSTAPEYLKVQCIVIARYFKKLFWPVDLEFYPHFRPVESMSQWLPGLVLIVVLIAAGFLALRWSRWAGVALLFPFLVLSPTSSVIPIPFEPSMEYRMYLPAVSLIGLMVMLVWRYVPNLWLRLGVVAILTVPLAVVSHKRTYDYETPLQVYSQDERVNPNGLTTLEGLAGIYLGAARYDLASEKAWRLIDWAMADNNKDFAARGFNALGMVESRKGNWLAARDYFLRAIAMNQHRSANLNLATVYVELKQYKEAEQQLRNHLLVSPDNPEALAMLIETKISAGELNEADKVLDQFMRLYPERHEMNNQRTRIMILRRNATSN